MMEDLPLHEHPGRKLHGNIEAMTITINWKKTK